jgi:hypothetical protein
MSGTSGGGATDLAATDLAFGAFAAFGSFGSLGALGSVPPSENEKLVRFVGGFSSPGASSAAGPFFRRKRSESLISFPGRTEARRRAHG